MPLKLAAIDFDGVILNSEPYHYYVRNGLLEAYCSGVAYDAADCVGKSVRAFYAQLLGKAGKDAGEAEHLAQLHFERVFDYLSINGVRENGDLMALLDWLRENGVRAAVASSSQNAYVLRCLDYLGLRERFDWVCGGDDVSRAKPDPEIYERVLALAGAAPGEAFAVEDSAAGIEAANRAGIRCFGYNVKPGTQIPPPGCIRLCRSFKEMIPVLLKLI